VRIIVTGGAGFIGSALVRRLVAGGDEVLVYDKLTYAGRREALAGVQVRFVEADICNARALDETFAGFEPEAVLHLAAETHVDRSIDASPAFVETNIRGTHEVLEAIRRWLAKVPSAAQETFRFVHVSTDEVFGALGPTGAFDVTSRYVPNSPYAASKAAADHLVRAWHETYGVPVIVTNCSNNVGPRQHAEKLIPTVIRYALDGAKVPIYGNGANVRDWLYVDDHADGLIAALRHGTAGATYLFGGRNERDNLSLARAICALLDTRRPLSGNRHYEDQITFVADRPGHDARYAIDPSVAETTLGWSAATPFDQGLAETIDWYLDNPDWLAPPSALGRLGLAPKRLVSH
jgi:dTDP-glucose 4,6-dehydratase